MAEFLNFDEGDRVLEMDLFTSLLTVDQVQLDESFAGQPRLEASVWRKYHTRRDRWEICTERNQTNYMEKFWQHLWPNILYVDETVTDILGRSTWTITDASSINHIMCFSPKYDKIYCWRPF